MQVLDIEMTAMGVISLTLVLAGPLFLGMVLSWHLLRGAFFAGERVLLGLTLGLTLFVALALISSLLFQFSTTILIVDSMILLLAAGAILRFCSDAPDHGFLKIERSATRTVIGKTDALGLGVFLVSFALFTLLMNRLILWREGGLFTGYIDAWGDLPFHLSLITSFVSNQELVLRSTILAGQPLTYPFLSDFFSAILMRFGLSLEYAVEWPGILLNSVTLTLLYYLSYRLVRNHAAAVLAPLLLVLAGGFGFSWFLQDIYLAPKPIWEFLQHLPRRYTNLPELKIHWVNATLAHLIPQRSFLFGFPMGLSVILIWWSGFKKHRFHNAWIAGLLVGLLPLFHAHTFLTLTMLAVCLMAYMLMRSDAPKIQVRPWLIFWGLVLALAGPQVWFILASKVSLKGIRFQPGWMADSQNLIWFWFKNLGVFIPMLLTAVVWRKRLNLRKQALIFYLPFGLLFILCNLFLFAPFAYDNNKIMIFWYMLSLPFVAKLLVSLHDAASWWLRAATVRTLLLALVFSGTLNLIHELQGGGWQELSAEEVALAQEVSKTTQSDDVFLTAPVHNNLLTLAGRAVFMGYTGHIYSHGLDTVPVEKTIKAIYAGKPGAPELLQSAEIDYIVVGPNERREYGKNVGWFEGNYPVFLTSENYVVYRVDEKQVLNHTMSSTY